MADNQPAQIDPADDSFFGPWLRQRRRSLDLTQDALAQQVGCAVDTVRKFEAGMRRPSHPMAERLAHCLAIPLAEQAAFLTAARSGRAPRNSSLSLKPATSTTVLPTPARRIGYLPASMTSFIGREWEISTVSTRIRTPDVRLVTLTGTGGVGKTRLALQIARALTDAFPDGVWFVNLAPISDPELVLPTMAQALGIREQAGTPIAETLRTGLSEKQVLVLLDNVEQVVMAAPELAALLADLPKLKLLVTSRAPLRLYGEHSVVVAPLTVPEPTAIQAAQQLTQYAAVQLFVERAHAVAERFHMTDANAVAIAAICARLDGLPLAIELAAAQIALFSPQALLARLDQRLPLLTRGPRDLPARQQTIRDTIAWSYDLLAPEEQRLFTRLAVFVGGGTIAAVEAICGNAGEHRALVLERITALIDKSLIRQVEQQPMTQRFVMLETIREYALERLNAADESARLRERHATYFLELAEAAEVELASGQREAWVLRLEQDNDNLQAALTWSQSATNDALLRLAGALWWFWYFCGYARIGRTWLEAALTSKAGQAATEGRAKALCGAGALADHQGDHATARLWLVESIDLYRTFGQHRGLGYALMYFGLVVSHQLDLSPSRVALTESIALLRQVGDRWGLALAIQYLGEIDWRESDFATAQALFEESAQLFDNLGDRWGHARALALVGFVLHSLGDDERARHLFAESSLVIRAIGDKFVLAALLNKQGQVLHCLNEYDQAMACFTESVTLFQELGNRQWTSDPLKNLGFIALHRGDTAQATSNFIKCIKLEYGGDNEASIAICLAGLAGVAVMQERYEWAARLYGAATAVLLHVNDDNPDPSNQRDWDQGLATLKAQCDPIAFAAAWAAGQALSLDQAVAEALGDQ